ncbi:structural cement protein Gp24 [Candidatus Arsenophonus triatominarum]|uniref:structural cement protein Gp24 n=1 Tax=Candidatus Arsenophonus triatominarum TaxID=57911 RepID=UPI0007C5CBA2|nr:hypothetical protein [Candidatus Arsenophonus triatominarum]
MSRFAWRDASNAGLVNNTGTGEIVGFVRNERTALVNWDKMTVMTIPQGQAVSAYKTGDFWVNQRQPPLSAKKFMQNWPTARLKPTKQVRRKQDLSKPPLKS